jgi:riboflavin synthase
MFTGIIEAVCAVRSAVPSAGAKTLSIDLGELAADAKIGDSIAVNGVCLTISELAGGLAGFDVSGETLSRSNLSHLAASSKVNVERALKAGDRFGGHIVLGHVDGTAKIRTIERRDGFAGMTFAAEHEMLAQMVPRGSVAVDGISLTIANLEAASFTAAVIPETLRKTRLGAAKVGDEVNIETDIITKTVKRLVERILPHREGLTVEKLKEMGF